MQYFKSNHFILVLISMAFISCVSASTEMISQPQTGEPFLSFDFADFQIGHAENADGPTGCTVLYFPNSAQAAIDIRGGSVGSFFTQEKMQFGEAQIDAIVLTGGGILGLEAVTGVTSKIFAQNQQQSKFQSMPLVTGGVIFDFTPRLSSHIFPDKDLGQQALAQAQVNQTPIGPVGVGRSATFGKLLGPGYIPSGFGAAFHQSGQTKIAVFTVVNAIGHIVDRNGEIVMDNNKRLSQKAFLQKIENNFNRLDQKAIEQGNTTLSVLIINEKLSARHLQQLGRQVHHAISQVIYPYSSIRDGDMLYSVSTKSQDSGLCHIGSEIAQDMDPHLIELGVIASQVAKEAVWSIVER